MRDFIVRYGQLAMLASGASLPEDGNVYIVQSGIIAVAYTPLVGDTQGYFLGTGGIYNLYTALTGGPRLLGSLRAGPIGLARAEGGENWSRACQTKRALRQPP